MSNHVVLLGDSILDNGAYVPGKPAVIDQVRGELPAGWTATLLAVDGSYTPTTCTTRSGAFPPTPHT